MYQDENRLITPFYSRRLLARTSSFTLPLSWGLWQMWRKFLRYGVLTRDYALCLPSLLSCHIRVVAMQILYFGPLSEAIGKEKESDQLVIGKTVDQFLDYIASKYPKTAPIIASSVVSVNLEYVDGDYTICQGDEVAIIPPISAG